MGCFPLGACGSDWNLDQRLALGGSDGHLDQLRSDRRRSRTIFWTIECWTVLLHAACCPFTRSNMNLLQWNTMVLHWFYKRTFFCAWAWMPVEFHRLGHIVCTRVSEVCFTLIQKPPKPFFERQPSARVGSPWLQSLRMSWRI